MKTKHSQVTVEHPIRGSVEVDEKIAALLQAMWNRSICTVMSCQAAKVIGHRVRGRWIWLNFCDADSLIHFLNAIAEALPIVAAKPVALDLYHRMTDPFALRAWIYRNVPLDWPNLNRQIDSKELPDPPAFDLALSVYFPATDYPLVLRAMTTSPA